MLVGRLRDSVSTWTTRTEVLIVELGAFGYALVSTASYLLGIRPGPAIVNPLFEELFVCGYVITVARESGQLALGVNASIAIRLAYHLYQGGIGVIGIIPLGLIFGLWFARTGRLWPVVVAHGIADFAGLVSFVN